MKTLCVAVALGMSAMVQAADFGDPPQLTVQVSDLNLADKRGVALVYARIERAARAVCELHNGADPALQEKMHRCKSQAIDGAVQQMHSVKLAEYRGHRKQGTG